MNVARVKEAADWVDVLSRRLDREELEDHNEDLRQYLLAVDELVLAAEEDEEMDSIDKGIRTTLDALTATALDGSPDQQGLDPFAVQHYLQARALLEQALAQFRLADLTQTRAVAGRY